MITIKNAKEIEEIQRTRNKRILSTYLSRNYNLTP